MNNNEHDALQQARNALQLIHPLLVEAMTLFQSQRGMVWQDMAKSLGKPTSTCLRALENCNALLDERRARQYASTLANRPAVQEPVGGIVGHKDGYPLAAFNTTDLQVGQLLYTHPAQPLSEKVIRKICVEYFQIKPSDVLKSDIGLARAFENAHGIGVCVGDNQTEA